LDKSYWPRFFAKRPELQQGKAITVSQKRTGACTQPVAEKHIADFCVEAKTLGIMDEAGKIADGSQVLNTDETPQQRAYAQARRNELLAGAKGHSLAPPRARTRGRARRGTPRVERRRDAAVLRPVGP